MEIFDRKNKKLGFTLIELLVVIAIIGILAAIVLVSLSSARQRAQQSRVQSSMAQVRAIAEMAFDGAIYPDGVLDQNDGFGTCEFGVATDPPNCTGDTTRRDDLKSLDGDVRAQQGSATCDTLHFGIVIQKQTGDGVNTTYRAFVLLPGGSLTVASPWWCVDSAGNSRQVTCTGIAGDCSNPADDIAAVCPTS